MNKSKRNFLIIIAIIVIIVVWFGGCLVGKYNTMVTMNESIQSSWAQVDVVLQRRYDLIPNLVETVKGYAGHEKEVFLKVTEARSKVGGAKSIPGKIAANNQLSSALARLLVVVENYPQLKANQNFLKLQDELAGTENRIAVERRRYNEAVKFFNQFIRQIPNNLIAGIFNFEKGTYYEIPEASKETPKVKF